MNKARFSKVLFALMLVFLLALAACSSDGNNNNDAKEYLSTTSIWTSNTGTVTSHPNDWVGGIAFGDGHVSTYKNAVLPTTTYNKVKNNNDNIFVVNDGTRDDSNAYMVYGNFRSIP